MIKIKHDMNFNLSQLDEEIVHEIAYRMFCTLHPARFAGDFNRKANSKALKSLVDFNMPDLSEGTAINVTIPINYHGDIVVVVSITPVSSGPIEAEIGGLIAPLLSEIKTWKDVLLFPENEAKELRERIIEEGGQWLSCEVEDLINDKRIALEKEERKNK